MGASSSSLSRITNDYELVVRASKNLERKLRDEFHGMDEIEGLDGKLMVLQGHLDYTALADLRSLNHYRNRLVHDVDVNGLDDLGITRASFVEKYEKGLKCLDRCTYRRYVNRHQNDGWSTCIIL